MSNQETFHKGEPAHVLRSIGNCVGKKLFSNTNRKEPKFTRRANKAAQKFGFSTHKLRVNFDLALHRTILEEMK